MGKLPLLAETALESVLKLNKMPIALDVRAGTVTRGLGLGWVGAVPAE